MSREKTVRFKLIFFALSGTGLLLAAPFIGSKIINFSSIFSKSTDSFILMQLRVPRTIMAFLAGASLSLGGLIFQNLFKNRLATPYTLGISSGASAGALLAIKFNVFGSVFGVGFTYFAGFFGGILSVILILSIIKITGSSSVYTVLLSGVAINFFFSSFILLIQYIGDMTQSISSIRWLMGSLTITGYKEIKVIIPLFVIFLIVILSLRKELILISAGDDFAVSKGMNVKSFRISIFILVSLITGVIVSVTGPIGFVGLIIPHLTRILVKNDFRLLILYSLFFGGTFLVIADVISRVLISPAEIPVGVITSFFGSPFFIYILISGTGKRG